MSGQDEDPLPKFDKVCFLPRGKWEGKEKERGEFCTALTLPKRDVNCLPKN